MYLSLEVSVGKATTIYATNGSSILLPCTFSSCYGFENLYFRWSYNNSETYRIVSGVLMSFPPVCPLPMDAFKPGLWSLLRTKDDPKNPPTFLLLFLSSPGRRMVLMVMPEFGVC